VTVSTPKIFEQFDWFRIKSNSTSDPGLTFLNYSIRSEISNIRTALIAANFMHF